MGVAFLFPPVSAARILEALPNGKTFLVMILIFQFCQMEVWTPSATTTKTASVYWQFPRTSLCYIHQIEASTRNLLRQAMSQKRATSHTRRKHCFLCISKVCFSRIYIYIGTHVEVVYIIQEIAVTLGLELCIHH